MITETEIEQAAGMIGRAAKAKKVVLFGSWGRGEAGQDSDVDYFVIAESDLPRFKRSRPLYALFDPYPFPMDIVVYTPLEVEQSLLSPTTFASTVLREGKELYVG
jgi:predicted nucleotidyltransferase